MIKPYQCNDCLLFMQDDFCKHYQDFITLPKDFDCEHFKPTSEFKEKCE